MSNMRMRAGGVLFAVGLTAIVIYAAVHKTITGRLPAELSYAVGGLIALSVLADIYIELTSAIEAATDEIKDKLTDLERKVSEIGHQCETLNWKLDAFKTEFDESANRSVVATVEPVNE